MCRDVATTWLRQRLQLPASGTTTRAKSVAGQTLLEKPDNRPEQPHCTSPCANIGILPQAPYPKVGSPIWRPVSRCRSSASPTSASTSSGMPSSVVSSCSILAACQGSPLVSRLRRNRLGTLTLQPPPPTQVHRVSRPRAGADQCVHEGASRGCTQGSAFKACPTHALPRSAFSLPALKCRAA